MSMGYIFLVCDIVIRVMIGIMPLRMIKGYNGKRYPIIIGTILYQGVVYAGLHVVILHYVNPIYTMKRVLGLGFSYAEILYFPKSFILSFVLSITLGFILRSILLGRVLVMVREYYPWCVCSSTLLFSGILFFVSGEGVNNLIITEICSNNENEYIAEYDSYCDYIEIQNRGMLPLNGERIYLTDDKEDKTKLEISNIQLQPGEYLVVGLIDEEKLAISKSGEYVYLMSELGQQVDSLYSVEQEETVAYSWMEEKGIWELRSCTPGRNNEESISTFEIESPIPSHRSGFYDSGFELELTVPAGGDVYYTLDGSIPTRDSIYYDKPIAVYDKSNEANVWRSIQNVVMNWKKYVPDTTPVDKVFIVRAIAFDNKGNQSEVITESYFIGLEKYKNKKVISLVAEPEALFGDAGIYVSGKEYDDWYLNGSEGEEAVPNFLKNQRDSEILASFQLFDGDHVSCQNVGIRIQGGSHRKSAIKRFSVIARKEFGGAKWFEEELFENRRTHAVVLREGFFNAVSPYLVKGRNLTLQQAIPVDVFLNGEFWYTTYMQEKICGSYLEELYGLKEDSAVIVKNGISEDATIQEEYEELCEFVENQDMSIKENYEKVCEKIDIQSFIDYVCINTYLCNLDWDDKKNYVLWKCSEIADNPYADGRFRWILYDMDEVELLIDSHREDDIPRINAFSEKGECVSTAVNDTVLFHNLKENSEFRKQFVDSYIEIIGTCFSEENVSDVLSEWGEDISWQDNFFIKRKEYALKHLKEEFNLDENYESILLKKDE